MAEQHEKALVPQIRFTSFTDPWEQRKLGELEKQDVLHLKRGIVISAADMESCPGNYPVYSSSASQNGEMGKYGKYMFNQELVTWSIDGGGSVFYRPKHKFSVTNVCGYVETSSMVDCAFLAYQMGYIHSQIHFDYTVKAHPSVIRDLYTLSWTSLTEQRRIGAFFDRLDSLITLHQRKYDKLCVLKKSMLDKMFPKGGSLYPEIRFAGFTDPWEQRKLGEVARRVTRKNENGDSDLPLTISAQYGLVDQRTFFNSQVASKDMNGYFLLHRGEFAYNKSTSTDSPWGAIKRLEKYDMGCVSTLYICFELLSGDPDFLVTYYETDRWYKSVQLIAAEGARNHGLLNIAPDDFFETQICIPKRIDEQRRIGAFFDRLDSLITLHQRKLELLRNIKKSMLDKMFV
uniref:restriction endonuclease subunit S n=1 Tax=Bifidobacterium adolescentis TaxID=1680 RepID=UPI00359CA488